MIESDRKEIFNQWLRLLLISLASAGDILATLHSVAGPWSCPADLLPEPGFINISDPSSGVCKLIRKALAAGIIGEADIDEHIGKGLSNPLNWKED